MARNTSWQKAILRTLGGKEFEVTAITKIGAPEGSVIIYSHYTLGDFSRVFVRDETQRTFGTPVFQERDVAYIVGRDERLG